MEDQSPEMQHAIDLQTVLLLCDWTVVSLSLSLTLPSHSQWGSAKITAGQIPAVPSTRPNDLMCTFDKEPEAISGPSQKRTNCYCTRTEFPCKGLPGLVAMIVWIITLWTCADALSWCNGYIEFLFCLYISSTGLEVLNDGQGLPNKRILLKYNC